MKVVEIETKMEFNPITLNVTIESKEELENLIKCLAEVSHSDTLFRKLDEIWNDLNNLKRM